MLHHILHLAQFKETNCLRAHRSNLQVDQRLYLPSFYDFLNLVAPCLNYPPDSQPPSYHCPPRCANSQITVTLAFA